jgi:integrator complex subunit 11
MIDVFRNEMFHSTCSVDHSRYAEHPPDPKRPRLLHGVLVMRGDRLTLMDPEDACAEFGISRHSVRFTSTVPLNTPSTLKV